MRATHYGVDVMKYMYIILFWIHHLVFREKPIKASSKAPLIQQNNKTSMQALASPSYVMFIKEHDNSV